MEEYPFITAMIVARNEENILRSVPIPVGAELSTR